MPVFIFMEHLITQLLTVPALGTGVNSCCRIVVVVYEWDCWFVSCTLLFCQTVGSDVYSEEISNCPWLNAGLCETVVI